ncbi:MAG: amidase [Roseovarius sp.]|nr:amidase [Roseovarius sp.]MCY4292433.1 amidase [Roseovarius sp.]
MEELHEISASTALDLIKSGRVGSLELVEACISRIECTDDSINAWEHIDFDQARQQAEEMDRIRRSGLPTGSLHGLPVGLKDIVDAKGLPTECGSEIFKGQMPKSDAALTEHLREEGAVVLGKTVSTECAFMNPSRTRNPRNLSRTPGGSSSGSAASVASCQVPLAIGTQTNGSVIRPAAFCGTFGFKPTRGVISRRGVLRTSKSLDQVGVFGRALEDVALLADAISGYDSNDEASYTRPKPQMLQGARRQVPIEPLFAWFELPFGDRLSDDSREGFEELLEALGDRVERVSSPKGFLDMMDAHRIVFQWELCEHMAHEAETHWELMGGALHEAFESGWKLSNSQYGKAMEVMAGSGRYFDAFFKDYDGIISPCAPGEAPMFDEGTGDPAFCTLWTFAGLPCVAMPILKGANDLPVGVQLIGERERDDNLLCTANWLLRKLSEEAE